jgi:uncharacterized phage protein (TIGR01671 family)
MRTILFRGKRIRDGQWIYGHYIYIDRHKIQPLDKWENSWEVYESTIGQYVGRDDPNGTKIFEGDVMACGTVVRFHTEEIGSCGCCYAAFYGTGFIVSSDDKLYYFDKRNHVIGNIHDNPELGKK